MKKSLHFIVMLAMMFGMTSLIISCNDDKKDEPYQSKIYAHYSLKVGADLTHFYDVKITYKTLNGTEHVVTLNEGQTEWKFDETSELDCPAFKCVMEATARDSYDPSYSSSDVFDFGYEYKCTAYSPSVGIRISQYTMPGNVTRDELDKFITDHPYQLILEFPQEIE